jgi:uncharacterized protein (DUF4415 family)
MACEEMGRTVSGQGEENPFVLAGQRWAGQQFAPKEVAAQAEAKVSAVKEASLESASNQASRIGQISKIGPVSVKRESDWRSVSDLVPTENKTQITLRLDAEVIDFFRATGRRYQSRINAALREYVQGQQKAG